MNEEMYALGRLLTDCLKRSAGQYLLIRYSRRKGVEHEFRWHVNFRVLSVNSLGRAHVSATASGFTLVSALERTLKRLTESNSHPQVPHLK